MYYKSHNEVLAAPHVSQDSLKCSKLLIFAIEYWLSNVLVSGRTKETSGRAIGSFWYWAYLVPRSNWYQLWCRWVRQGVPSNRTFLSSFRRPYYIFCFNQQKLPSITVREGILLLQSFRRVVPSYILLPSTNQRHKFVPADWEVGWSLLSNHPRNRTTEKKQFLVGRPVTKAFEKLGSFYIKNESPKVRGSF